jgi:biotin carboxylase
MGLLPIVTDGNPSCPARWDSRTLFFHVSTYDIDNHRKLAQYLRGSFKIAGVLTVAADVGPTVSAIAEDLNLPACSLKAAMTARDKIRMRSKLALEHPRWLIHGPDASVQSAMAALNWRPKLGAAVKAPSNRASRGFSLVPGNADTRTMEQAIEQARKASQDGFVLIEEALAGPEIAIDAFVVDGTVQIVNVADRKFLRPGLEIGHINPGPDPDDDVKRLAQLAAERLGVDRGPFKLDLIRDEEYGWTILEAATRLSGGFDHMWTAVRGPEKDITGMMIQFALGQTIDFEKAQKRSNLFCAARAPVWAPGKIIGYRCKAEVGEFFDYIALDYEQIKPLHTPADRPLFAFGLGQSAEEAWEEAGWVLKQIEPIYV